MIVSTESSEMLRRSGATAAVASALVKRGLILRPQAREYAKDKRLFE